MSLSIRLLAATLLLAYLAFLAFVLGQSDASFASSVVLRCADVLQRLGAPIEITARNRVEFLLNVAMFAPAALLAALTFPRHHWANWAVYGFVASGSVEGMQGLFLPMRSAQYVDVVANTAGMLAGALASVLLVRVLAPAGDNEASPELRAGRTSAKDWRAAQGAVTVETT